MAYPEMEKILASITIERALIDVGGAELHESVQNLLYSEYGYHFSDCLEHPESLRNILEKRHVTKYDDIIQTIKNFLGETSWRTPFLEFVEKIDR